MGLRELHHGARWIHAERHRHLRREAQRRERTEDGKDGSSDNRFWNMGVEGPTGDPNINAQRERQIRNLLATLLLSQGTPMLLAGDEFCRTQGAQQQRLLPGQRHQLGWTGTSRKRGDSLISFVKRLTKTAPRARHPEAEPLSVRRVRRGAGREGRHLDQRVRRRDEGRAVARRWHALLRYAHRRTGAAKRHPEAGWTTRRCCSSSTPRRTPSTSRFHIVQAAEEWNLLIDTNRAIAEAAEFKTR